MASIAFTCSQCLYAASIESASRFCPRCGMPIDPPDASSEPVTLRYSDGTVTAHDRFALGDLCNLYRCEIGTGKTPGVFKIARSHVAGKHISREAQTLRRLRLADVATRFAPFLPQLDGALNYQHTPLEPARAANVLSYFEAVTPDELYSLEEVRAAYPSGIDARDMAWIWRRVLTILGFVHSLHLAHGAVTPDHVLIEPVGHKLILIGWSAAAPFGMLPHLAPMRWRDWTASPDTCQLRICSAASDLGCAARTMSYLLGDPVEPAIMRHLQRAGESSDALRLLADFDAMIEVLWGPKRFREFKMPPRR
jgi:serine/threonine protein kinase